MARHRPNGQSLIARIRRKAYATPLQWSAAWGDQAGLVGQDDGMDTVAEAELG